MSEFRPILLTLPKRSLALEVRFTTEILQIDINVIPLCHRFSRMALLFIVS